MKEMICICCPMGCHLVVDDKDKNNIIVTGNTCPRGKTYAIDEVIAPKRMVTSTVKVQGGDIPMVSVKTSAPIPKEKIFDSLALLNDIELSAPILIGDIVLENVCGTGIDFIATKNVNIK
ncbi:MAG: DUF1667 domain-containing protein [Clostridia bacterium]